MRGEKERRGSGCYLSTPPVIRVVVEGLGGMGVRLGAGVVAKPGASREAVQ